MITYLVGADEVVGLKTPLEMKNYQLK